MASVAQTLPISVRRLSIEEYLSSSFQPDVDYVDGKIEERNAGEADHGIVQFIIANYFYNHRTKWNVRMYLDTRLQISEDRFRVPDVSIGALSDPREQIIRTPPILCVEVLSPEDTLGKMLVRVQDYFEIGVPTVWIFEPQNRSVAVCSPDGSYTRQVDGQLTLPGTLISVDIGEVFGALDEE